MTVLLDSRSLSQQCVCERERERERDREIDRDRDRQTERKRERQRETERERKKEREGEREMHPAARQKASARLRRINASPRFTLSQGVHLQDFRSKTRLPSVGFLG